jgi:hypothetical protein
MDDDPVKAFMFSKAFYGLVLSSYLACMVTMLGIMIITWFEERGMGNAACFMSRVAWAVIAVFFVHINQRSITMNASASIYWFAGFWALYRFDRFLNSLDQQSVYGRLAIDSHVVFSLPYVSSYLDNPLPQ